MKFILISFLSVFAVSQLRAQNTDSLATISLTGYADAYYAYYTEEGIDHFVQFPSVSPTSNEFGLNVASIAAKYTAEKARATVALQYGNIPASTWAPNLNAVQEANAGIRLCKKLWLDGGFFRTHLGAEGLFPKENMTSSVAVPTFYEPYYEAGFKLSYTPTEKLAINLLLLNGFNLYEDNNKKKSVGLLATYAFSDHFNIGYSNYIGDDSAPGDTTGHLLVYNNIFLNYDKNKFKLLAGVDFASKQNSSLAEDDQAAVLISGLLTMRYLLSNKFNVYVRGEYIFDKSGYTFIFFPGDFGGGEGLKLGGATLGFEYKPVDNAYIRIEGRYLQAADHQNIFYWDGEYTNARLEAMLTMGVSFTEIFNVK